MKAKFSISAFIPPSSVVSPIPELRVKFYSVPFRDTLADERAEVGPPRPQPMLCMKSLRLP